MGLEDIILAAVVKEIVEKVKNNKKLRVMIRKVMENGKSQGKPEVKHA
jgi:hypothetical protein